MSGFKPITTVTKDFLIEVAKGNVPGHTTVGQNTIGPDITNTGYLDVWNNDANLVYPTVAETWEIVSTDANDTSAGTGARTVLISYLDDNYVSKSIIANMNGLTAVTLNTDHFRPNRLVVLTSGSSRTNEGDITVQVSGAGNPRSFIMQGSAISSDSHFSVPSGMEALVLSIILFFPKNESGYFRGIRTSFSSNTDTVITEFPFYQNTFAVQLPSPLSLNEKSDFRFMAISDNAGPIKVNIFFEYMLVDV